MQALKTLFSRAKSPVAAAPAAKQPTLLSPESLKLVGGGLPRIGGLGGSSATVGEGEALVDALPRVS